MNDMITPRYDTEFPSVRGSVSDEEWQARVDLAACYRLMDHYGMTDMIYNHITLRIPGTHHLLINLYGLTYKEVTASSLMKIDVDGNILWKPKSSDYGINQAGYVIHGAIHRARDNVDSVIHTHTRAGMAISAMKCGLLPLNQTAIRFHGHLAYHAYEGPALDLGDHDAMILKAHGLLSCGATIAQTFNTIHQLELACRAQVDAMAARTELDIPSPEILAATARLYQPGVRRPFGVMEWPAMIRTLEIEAKASPYPYYAS